MSYDMPDGFQAGNGDGSYEMPTPLDDGAYEMPDGVDANGSRTAPIDDGSYDMPDAFQAANAAASAV